LGGMTTRRGSIFAGMTIGERAKSLRWEGTRGAGRERARVTSLGGKGTSCLTMKGFLAVQEEGKKVGTSAPSLERCELLKRRFVL